MKRQSANAIPCAFILLALPIGIALGLAIHHQGPTVQENKLPKRASISANMGVKYQNHSSIVPCDTDYNCMVLNGGDDGLYEMDDYYDLCDRVVSCVPGTEMEER